jgi:outer membrane immunogenic protein
MKKFLLSSVAFLGLATAAAAADLPARTMAPAPFVAVPVFTWTGFYVGAQVGYSWGNDDALGLLNGDVVTVGGVPFVVSGVGGGDDSDGFVLGGHVGYNVQFGSFVVGVEGDLEYADLGGNNNAFVLTGVPGVFALNSGLGIDWQGSIRARLGFAFDRVLVYATGGFAFASIDDSNNFAILAPGFVNGDDSVTGWTLGVGVEYAITNNLTTRLEYRYTNYDDSNNAFFDNVALNNGGDLDFHTVRLGLSYKF